MGRIAVAVPLWASSLRFHRHREGMSQATFGSLFGVSQQTVAKWELGYFEPPMAVVIWLVDRGGTLS